MVTSARPRRLVVAPGSTAYALVNKYRCDAGDLSRARRIAVTLRPGGPALHRRVGRDADLGYCGAGDPGSVVHVSPFEPTASSTLAHP